MTNTKFIKALMEGTLPEGCCPTGALVQCFILEALSEYSKRVVAAGPEACDTSFLSGEAWVATASHVQHAVGKHLESNQPNENQPQ